MSDYFVKPKTFLVGYTTIDIDNLKSYLEYTDNIDFLESVREAESQGLSPGEILCSFYAKLCYKSLTLGKNSNVSRIRDISSNLENVIETGHGSVLECCSLNFVTTDCSRILTHELCRHRVGMHFSQTSGRYVRLDDMKIIIPPELEDCKEELTEYMEFTAKMVKRLEEKTGLTNDKLPFSIKKKITSAIRRIAPNGIANEIGWSANLRSLRHIIELRTSEHAEWEIRLVFNQVADIVLSKWPHILYGAKVEEKDGLKVYTNLRV